MKDQYFLYHTFLGEKNTAQANDFALMKIC